HEDGRKTPLADRLAEDQIAVSQVDADVFLGESQLTHTVALVRIEPGPRDLEREIGRAAGEKRGARQQHQQKKHTSEGSMIQYVFHMKYLTFERGGAPEPGVVKNDEIVSLKSAGFPDLISVIAGGAVARARVEDWIGRPPASEVVPLRGARLLAP